MQYARVPVELVQLVDANAVAVYVVLCKYAHRTTGRLWPSNPELVDETLLSLATVKRALRQLERVGAIERKGRQARKMHVVPFERLQLTGEPRVQRTKAHPRAGKSSPVSYGTTATEPELTSSLRAAVTDESEGSMSEPQDQGLFEVEPVPPRPRPVAQEFIAAFVEAYGTEQPVSRQMIARLGKRAKELSETYPDEEILQAARELGRDRIANPNAVEPFILRARQPRHAAQQRSSQWSALATDTLTQWPDPFA